MNATYNTADRPSFVSKQYAFAAHIRDPENNQRPGDVEERRMKIYRELFYNNVEDFMANTYPVLRKILSNEHWHRMIRDYFAKHLSHTPLFPEMPKEFLRYLEHERVPQSHDPVFMLELAHYEWVELALSILDEEIDWSALDAEADLLQSVPQISSLAWSLSYHFPVHKISPSFQPEAVDENLTHLVVYRDRHHEVNFIKANPVTARLIQLIAEDGYKTGQALLEQIATELNHPQPDIVINGGLAILTDLKKRDVVLVGRQ